MLGGVLEFEESDEEKVLEELPSAGATARERGTGAEAEPEPRPRWRPMPRWRCPKAAKAQSFASLRFFPFVASVFCPPSKDIVTREDGIVEAGKPAQSQHHDGEQLTPCLRASP